MTQRGPVIAVGGVVLVSGPRVLLVRRANPPRKGCASLPGGKLKGGETVEEGVAREVLEETGIAARVLDRIDSLEIRAEGYHYLVHDHLCVPVDPAMQPRAGSDALHAYYVDVSRISDEGVTPEVAAVIDRGVELARSRAIELDAKVSE